MSQVEKRYATDETFREVADLLFGAGGDEIVAKMNPDGADLHVKGGDKKKKRKGTLCMVEKKTSQEKLERRQAQVGLASNVVGLGAGVAGTAAALRDERLKEGGKIARGLYTAGSKIPKPISSKAGKTGALLAGGALGLQLANVGGDVVANRVLNRAAKKPGPKPLPIDGNEYNRRRKGRARRIKKSYSLTDLPDQALYPKKHLTRAAITTADRAAGKGTEYTKGYFKKLPEKLGHAKDKLKKNADFDVKWEGEISKVNEDKQQVFGWASIVEVNGEPVVDLQGDYIAIDEVEKAAYTYVHKSRKGGDMHLRDGDAPVHASDMIESFVVTPEKKEALGLPDEMPTGWWVGYQVNDPGVWAKVKSGERTGFSIHGRGRRSDG